jgi:hypothetical protein
MIRKTLSLVLLMIVLAVPMSASQFIEQRFDDVARNSELVLRGTVESVYSRWDDSREVIYTYATVRVKNYFADTTGPDTIVVREVGGTVDDYTMAAVGFPELRTGEDVVLFLSRWDNGVDYRMEAYNQGKYLVRENNGRALLHRDLATQGHERQGRAFSATVNARPVASDEPGLSMDEFTQMVNDAREGREVTARRDRN